MATDSEKEPLISKAGQSKRIQFRQATQRTMVEIVSQWSSVWVACLVSFLCGATFALFLMSIWPYLQSVYPTTTTTFYSVVVAAFSLGRGLSSPLFGYVSNRLQTVKGPIIFGCCILICGNLMYAMAQLATGSSSATWIILFSRLLMGIGAGVVPLTIAYCSTATVEADRAKAISLAMASNVFGAGVGPGLQLAFTPLGNGFKLFSTVRFDMYTAPAYVGCLTMVVVILLMIFTFKEDYAGIASGQSSKEDSGDGEKQKHVDKTPDGRIIPPFDKVAIAVILLIWFVSSCVITTLESIASPYMMVMYNLQDQDSIVYSSALFLVCAVLTAVCFAVYSYTRLHDMDTRYFVFSGLGVLILFHLVTYPWPFYTGQIVYSSSWCNDVPQVPLVVIVIGYLLFFSIGMAETAAPLGVLYASVIGPRRQGTMQGIYAQCNATARTISPIVMLALFGSFGPGVAWLSEMAFVCLALIVALIFRNRLVPLKIPETKQRSILQLPSEVCYYDPL